MAGSNCRRIHHLVCALRILYLAIALFVHVGLVLDKIRHKLRTRITKGVLISHSRLNPQETALQVNELKNQN
jgi:hypothetical protein